MRKLHCYFDYAATTPVDPKVVKAMQPYFFDIFGNPASVHSYGQAALRAVDTARQVIADFLGCPPLAVIFTAGATESNNLALQGLLAPGQHLITTTIEHPSVLEVCQALEKTGLEVSYIGVDAEGLVKSADILAAIKKNTALISVMYVNNEIGTIEPITEIGAGLKVINQQRRQNNLAPVYFHTDAVQAAFYCNLKVNDLGVDLLSLSGHKIYGPKGIGVLYRRQAVPLRPVLRGGPQEFGLRPGSLNTAAIVGLAQAVRLIADQVKHDQTVKRIQGLRDEIKSGVKKILPAVKVNGTVERRVGGNLSLSFSQADAEALLIQLDQAGIAVSVGSACSAGSLAPSPVLGAIGLKPDLARGTIRISLGKFNNYRQVQYFLKTLALVLKNQTNR